MNRTTDKGPLAVGRSSFWLESETLMTVAELIIADARQRGLRHFFGLPGGGFPLDMMEAGRRLGVDFVPASHESSAAIMAAYYGVIKQTAGLAH